LTRRNRSVSDIYDLFCKSERDNVRWEKVKHFRLILTNGACPVPSELVAAKLIERMLERGRSQLRRSHSKLSSETGDTLRIDKAGMRAR
jgi:hypothetical protein